MLLLGGINGTGRDHTSFAYMQTLHPSHWHLLNPEPSTFLNCRHIVILFWCAEALGQRVASVSGEQRGKEDLTPNPACSVWWLPRCLSYSTSWIMWGWVDIFIWSTNDTLQSRYWCVYWLRRKFPSLSYAYINISSAPFTLSIAVVMKSALCHVHLKYLMFLRSWNLSPHEWTL